jgi:5-bromo-4-chloroindolyl phosphate hydrolysis protein
MQKWVQEMDRLNRIGPPGGTQGYSWQEIRQIIDFSQDDDFWRANILSASKLREKCVQLENQMKRSKKPRGQPTMSKNVANALRLVEKYAQEESEAL